VDNIYHMALHEAIKRNLDEGRKVFTSDNQPANRGRSANSLNRSTIFKKWLGAKVTTQDINGVEVTLSVEDAIVIAQARKAIEKGDTMAAMFLFEGKYGKVKDVVGEGSTTTTIDYSTFTVEELQVMKRAQELMARKANEARNNGIQDAEIVGE